MQNHDADSSNQNDIWYCNTEITMVLKSVPSTLTFQPWLLAFYMQIIEEIWTYMYTHLIFGIKTQKK